ncbi:MSMEG_1061 family FMN-dependent PPOX-type flavoprotein [Pararhodobacter sp. CCB-MM2]|uniref:MSMEG_1061 family FMN-dependent PPOX-type flavoprotein n=1 Tax=Pararhodobacter sp. CCB-MM2 TaxID=1786003 RepID=UPI0008321819|nr:MSMEG_1061 family FMN-dependent PPOX-type flavoprotein [Pararhodobacter sp. CCB-MM2]
MAITIADPVDSPEKLRAILPRWTGNASKKDLGRVNEVAAAFIARSPYVVISSHGADGRHDLSPKGDAPGFITVHDPQTLLIPDRLGNHRLDTFENLLTNPALGLIFLIPGNNETLRIAGTGRIARDEALRAPFAVNGKLPELVLVVTVEQVFMHCSKSSVRSRLWKPAEWPDTEGVPTLAQWVKSHVATEQTLEEIQAVHDNDRLTRLY